MTYSILHSNLIYLALLLISISGLLLLDFQFKLMLFDQPKATVKTIGVMMGIFLVWDGMGILLRIFSTNQAYVSGLYLFSKNLPIEEFLFLFLLNYSCLIIFGLLRRRHLNG